MSRSNAKRSEPAVRTGPRTAQGALRKLRTYHEKRDFEHTPEPSGRARSAATVPRGLPAFVVQKHAARRLHYDFRLEIGGVLVSWAVPKGPSTKPSERRLAVRTEDHPRDYLMFEGTIPEGAYGAGEVVVWDAGTFDMEGDADAMLKKGHLTFKLYGQKLHGKYHLIRTGMDGKQEQWLLVRDKHSTEEAHLDPVRTQPDSVLPLLKRAKPRTAARVAKAPPDKRTVPERQRDFESMVRALAPDMELTNLDKVLYPEQGLRKAELIAYYACVAPAMLPFVARRPLTLVRCPNGRAQKCFFQKHPTAGTPAAIGMLKIRESEGPATYMTVDDMAGLMAVAQLGALEVHTWGCHADDVEHPDELVIDLDPDEGLGWDAVVEAALDTRAHFAELDLQSFVKTTGGKGLHVVVPLRKKLDWDAHKAFARAFTERMAERSPERYVVNVRKAKRHGKLFLDYLRNGRGATYVAPYSTRARDGATVATPISWEELERGVDPKAFDVRTVVARLDQQESDPWPDFAKLRQTISARALRGLGL